MRRTPLPLPPPLPQMLFWLKVFFFPFNRKILSQQNEINYLTNRGTKEKEGGVLPSSEPRCTGRMLQTGAGRGALLLPCWGLLSPINCHFQDYQSLGLGAWLWPIAVWQKSSIRSPGHASKVIGTERGRMHPEHGAARAMQTSPVLRFSI